MTREEIMKSLEALRRAEDELENYLRVIEDRLEDDKEYTEMTAGDIEDVTSYIGFCGERLQQEINEYYGEK